MKFFKTHKALTFVLCMAMVIIVAYYVSYDWEEWFVGAGRIFELFCQLSIGYVVNFIFYVTQVYIPEKRRTEKAVGCIKKRLEKIVSLMKIDIIGSATHVYIGKQTGSFSKQELLSVLQKLNFSDNTKLASINKLRSSPNVFFTFREWWAHKINEVNKEIDCICKYYVQYITGDIMELLEKIIASEMHNIMVQWIVSNQQITFQKINEDIFLFPYYQLACSLDDMEKKL